MTANELLGTPASGFAIHGLITGLIAWKCGAFWALMYFLLFPYALFIFLVAIKWEERFK